LLFWYINVTETVGVKIKNYASAQGSLAERSRKRRDLQLAFLFAPVNKNCGVVV
jgi:hypothetical protein